MVARTVTLSSAGVSAFVNLDWMQGKPVVAQLSLGSSTIVVDYTLQATLNDIQLSSSPVWFNVVSSGPWGSGTFASTGGHLSSATFDNIAVVAMNPPPAALRINSSTNTSSGTITLRVLQGG